VSSGAGLRWSSSSEDVASVQVREATAEDLVAGRPLHEATWDLLLQRAGFVEVAPLPAGAQGDGRVALSAVAPR